MKVVILTGGMGTRLAEETAVRPKPMVEIGGRPILWHIMKIYSAHGFNEFVICLGFKGYYIKEFFSNYFLHMSDVTFDMKNNKMEVHREHAEPWRVTLVDTGEKTMTGGRVKRVLDYVRDDEVFALTYGDGVGNIDVAQQLAFHRQHGRLATVTAVRPAKRFGSLSLDGERVASFAEKPEDEGGWISGGFFLLSPKIGDLIDGDDTILERGPMMRLAEMDELRAFVHPGFWAPMDTLRDKIALEEQWASGAGPMEGLVIDSAFWRNRRVFITGHTGFKGSWLALMLSRLNAQCVGYALAPPTNPNLFEILGVGSTLQDIRGDIGDFDKLKKAMIEARPEIVIHLAAQPLVRRGYADPISTYGANVMGVVNLLEALRATPSVRVAINVTTDKCYDNRESIWGYREHDRLGGRDPYSSSKACAELVTSAFRASYFNDGETFVATARAGNVVGGGDFADDRILPDAFRAFSAGLALEVRCPSAVRPWQHVLEPLSGYLMLAEQAFRQGRDFANAWNFGPGPESERDVESLLRIFMRIWGPEARWKPDRAGHPHEAGLLRLDSTRSREKLGWRPVLAFEETIDWTAQWYSAFASGADMRALTLAQVDAYLGQRVRLTSPFIGSDRNDIIEEDRNAAQRIA